MTLAELQELPDEQGTWIKTEERGEKMLQQLVRDYLKSDFTDAEFADAEADARRKLDRIISREGDANGERLKPYYLARLISEYVQICRLHQKCKELYHKKKSAYMI